MNRRIASEEPCSQIYHRRRPDRWQQCGRPQENTCTQLADHNQELTPQHIVLMMAVAIALWSSLCVFVVWYLGAASMENIRKKTPV